MTKASKSTTSKVKIGAADKWDAPDPDSVVTITDEHIRKITERRQKSRLRGGCGLTFNKNPAVLLYEQAIGGNIPAANALLTAAIECVELLNRAADETPDIFRKRAGRLPSWPILATPTKKGRSEQANLFKKIGLGSDLTLFRYLEDVGEIKTPVEREAWRLISLITAIAEGAWEYDRAKSFPEVGSEEERRELFAEAFVGSLDTTLPEYRFETLKFTSDILKRCESLDELNDDPVVIGEWWSIAKYLLMLNTDGHPERLAGLRAIGIARKNHPSSLSSTGTNMKSVEANIRSKIFTDLKKTFTHLAKVKQKFADRTR